MNRLIWVWWIVTVLAGTLPVSGQNQVITTVAGGGPNNTAALSASLSQLSGGAFDLAGNYYVCGESQVFRIDLAGHLTVIAGNGSPSYSGDGGPATKAGLFLPSALAFDVAGNLYIADARNNRVRKVSAATGVITTIAGNGLGCSDSPGKPATATCVWYPTGVAIDFSGNLLITDVSHLWRVSAATGIIDTVAGTNTQGFSGDGGLAKLAQLFEPYGIRLDTAGNIYIADRDNNRIRKVTVATGIITTVAGNGTSGYTGDGGLATAAGLNHPWDIAIDAAGNLFLADAYHSVVRRVDSATGIIMTIAGTGTPGYNGDGIPATQALLYYPFGLAFDTGGNLYVAEYLNFRVRRILASTKTIETVAGNAFQYYSGDNGPAGDASLGFVTNVVSDISGNLYISSAQNTVRRVDAISGKISTITGNGVAGYTGDGGLAANAEVGSPEALALDGSGALYVAEGTHVRRVALNAGTISTVVGNTSGTCVDGGLAAQCRVTSEGIAADGAGNLYVSDWAANRIYRAQLSTGTLTFIAGTGTSGFSGDGALAKTAQLNGPKGIVVDAAGNIYFADTFNNRIRRIDGVSGIITTVVGDGTRTYKGDGGPGVSAGLNQPRGVALDSSGSLFIVEGDGSSFTTGLGNRLRRLSLGTGLITTVAGTGSKNFGGDGGPGVAAELSDPWGVSTDANGRVYIADHSNYKIRKLMTPDPVLTITKTHAGSFVQGQTGALYTVSVSNGVGAGPTSGPVTVTETVPFGLTLVSMTGAGWNCAGNTCLRGDALNPGTSYPAITVTANVAANASSPVTNQVQVSGGNAPAASATDPTVVNVNPPVLSISKTHSGSFAQGQTGALYMVTVSNGPAAGPAIGTVTVTETIPPGLTLVGMKGLGWSCAAVTCSRNDALIAGASFTPITVTVNVAVNAPSQVINSVAVSGGGAAAAITTDTTNIAAPSPPFGVVDTPADNLTGVTGAIGITGWALSNSGIAKLEFFREANPGEAAPGALLFVARIAIVQGARPDVAAAFPAYPGNDRGWGAQILTNQLPNSNGTPGVGSGTFKIHVIATDNAGLSSDIGKRTFTTDNAHATLPFGTIDTPGNGDTVSGPAYVVFGWAVTPNPTNVIPKDASSIFVFVDNLPVGHPVYNNFRQDIATIFPGLQNSSGAVGYYILDTTKLTNGLHSLAWSVQDNAGNLQGIGSRAFIVQN